MQYNFKLGQVVAIGFCSVFVVMLIIAIISKLTTTKLIESNGWVTHTYQVEANLEDITKLLINAETGQRGYILTQQQDYLEPFNQSVTNFEATFNEVSLLLQDNPEQLTQLNQVKQLAIEKMAELKKTIELNQKGKRQDSINLILSNQGKEIMDEIRSRLEKMTQIEEQLLAERQQIAKQTASLADIVSLGGTTIAILLGLLILFVISRAIVQPITQVAKEIAASSNEISATVEQQERTMNQQANSVSETTTTVNELSASAQQSAHQASTAYASAQQVLNLADQGNQMISNTLKTMAVLNQKVCVVADQIFRLNEQTKQIGSISGLVTDLANQTNMLALNASVEAVRAGEQGKGFAVVAAEIRKLADESKKSAGKINGLVDDIQSAINSTVVMTNESTQTAQQGAVMTEQTVDVFTNVTDAVNSMVLNLQQISLTANQQATAVQQILQAMNTLDSGARETASGISQTRISTHQLNDAASKLQSVV